MDFRSFKRLIQERISRYGTSDPDQITHAMADAIRFYSTNPFYFNEGTYDITLTAGTENYGQESSAGVGDGYPADMIKPIKLSLNVSSSWYDMFNVPVTEYRRMFIESTYTGYPKHWTWFGKEILLDPSPNDDHTIRLDYTKDIGIPVESYSGSAWSWTDSTDGATIDAAWENDWLITAVDLIAARTCWQLVTFVYKNEEGGMQYKVEEMRQFDDLRVASEHTQSPGEVMPWV